MTAPWHFGQTHTGQTLQWMHTDNEDNFQRMMQDPAHADYFVHKGWDKPSAISYSINQQGFRGQDIDSSVPGMLALGCSFTFGSGLPESVLWPTLVADQLSLAVWNLAWPGTAADTCYRLAEYWIPELKPKLVCALIPPRDRFELITSDPALPVEVFMSTSESSMFSQSDMYLKHWFVTDQNAWINQRKNARAIQALCNEHDIPCIIKYADQEMSGSREELEYARDYMHAGPRGHQLLAGKILNECT